MKVEGELDAGRYGGVLRARGLVGVRGAGYLYDGLYYVKQVTHKVALGSYSESFELDARGRRLHDPGGARMRKFSASTAARWRGTSTR